MTLTGHPGQSTLLTQEEIDRYKRHLALPEVGVAGQEQLKRARVLLVGVGGLGSPAGLYLAAAGVGRLGLVDFDHVDITNLHRQVLYGDADVGKPILEVASKVLRARNPHIEIELHDVRLQARNAPKIFDPYDIIVDGTDNFATRFLVNDACVLMGKPNVQGSIYGFEGQISVFAAAGGPCYRCLYPKPPPPDSVPNCAEGGVLGVLPGLIGLLQATETIKLILGQGDPLVGRLLTFDALSMTFRELKFKCAWNCKVCGEQPTIKELTDIQEVCDAAGAGKPRQQKVAVREISPAKFKQRLTSETSILLLDVRDNFEVEICKIDGSVHIPLGELSTRLDELPRNQEIVVYCHMGGRSLQAAEFLAASGFQDVKNLSGGILAWANKVDPTLTKY